MKCPQEYRKTYSAYHCQRATYSLSGKTSYRPNPWRLEAARLDVLVIISLWNWTGISAALLPRCLSNFRAIEKIFSRISWIRDFTRSCSKTSYRLVNGVPEWCLGCDSVQTEWCTVISAYKLTRDLAMPVPVFKLSDTFVIPTYSLDIGHVMAKTYWCLDHINVKDKSYQPTIWMMAWPCQCIEALVIST